MLAFGGPKDILVNSDTGFNEQKQLFSLYNWEIGLHAPMMMINRFFKSRQYEEALSVCHYVFDPHGTGPETDTRRFWVFPPFKYIGPNTIESYFLQLKAVTPM
jgi:hypothetical protein